MHCGIGDKEAQVVHAKGWYLYGIVEQRPADSWGSAAHLRQDTDDIQLLQHADVAAVVRSVEVADYQPETIRAHMHDPRWLEVMAAHHHSVIESIHRLRPILPATFGCVYADENGLRAGLSELHETLFAQLQWIADCDEWTVRLYGDVASMTQSLIQDDPRLLRLQREIDSVSPGRAYLLQRKMVKELATVMEEAIGERAEKAFTQVNRTCRCGILQARVTDVDGSQGERELLRAVFLTPRPSLEAFIEDVESIASQDAGLRSEYSGPWPPYSFAKLGEERPHA